MTVIKPPQNSNYYEPTRKKSANRLRVGGTGYGFASISVPSSPPSNILIGDVGTLTSVANVWMANANAVFSNQTLLIKAGQTLSIDIISCNNYGIINNYGTVIVKNGENLLCNSGSTFNNYGNLTINLYSNFVMNRGTITNNNGASILNQGSVSLTSTTFTNSQTATVTNNNLWTTTGMSIINNNGSLTNGSNGQMYLNNSSSINQLVNDGSSITNLGQFIADSQSPINIKAGTYTNNGGATLTVCYFFYYTTKALINAGIIIFNKGQLIFTGANLIIEKTGHVINNCVTTSGFCFNSLEINGGLFTNQAGATAISNSLIMNGGRIDNSSTFTINSTATSGVVESSTITNNNGGTFNLSSCTFFATITNNSGCTINLIPNNSSDTSICLILSVNSLLVNNGTINCNTSISLGGVIQNTSVIKNTGSIIFNNNNQFISNYGAIYVYSGGQITVSSPSYTGCSIHLNNSSTISVANGTSCGTGTINPLITISGSGTQNSNCPV
jgi:hypothetical protein